MPVLSIMNQVCAVLRAAVLPDRYGPNTNTRDWANATSTPLARVAIQPSSTTEDSLERQTTVSGWRFYGPPETDLLATDRVEWYGKTFEVVGEPQPWMDPLNPGAIDHWEAPLEIILPTPRPVP
jgi:hypothetical protein